MAPKPPDSRRATVNIHREYLFCSGHGAINDTNRNEHQSFKEFQEVGRWDKWCIVHLTAPNEAREIIHAVCTFSAIAVSDGSYKTGYGTCAGIITGTTCKEPMFYQAIVPGGAQDHSSYRSELTGIYSTITIVNMLCAHYKVTKGVLPSHVMDCLH
jgi:hypothetical protein